MEKKFKLFACCLPTKGASRSTISDLQRGDIYFIPNSLFTILHEHDGKSIDEIKEYYGNENDAIIEEYFDYLIKKELGFFCDNPENFKKIDLSWDRPELITNAIIDLDKTSRYDIDKLLSDLQDLGCKNVEFRIYNGYTHSDVMELCLKFADSIFRYISILIGYDPSFTIENAAVVVQKYPRIQNLVIFNSSDEVSIDSVCFTKTKIESSNCCGVVNYKYFTSNLEIFAESQQFNSCLNRKVSVDINGYIKNCPSMSNSFGHIDKTGLREVVQQQVFQEFWGINKEQIDVCKVCEFRNVCTDCRAFTIDSTSKFAKPSKCSYNPYSSTWE